MKKILLKIAFVTLFAALLVPATAFAKGPIVIKTLPYTISVPGNYTLAAKLTYTADLVDAITISASNVTLDMNGFGITGPGIATSDYSGITINGNGVEVRNGYITGFYDGFNIFGIGIKALNLKIYENAYGIDAVGGAHCATVCGCTVYGNPVVGISACGAGNIVTNNVSYNNGDYGIYAIGQSCITGNSSYGNTGVGIYAGPGSTVKNNSSCNNGTYGIQTAGTVLLDGNAATGNNGGGVGINYSVAGATLGTNTP